ncbi:MAG: BolA family transcriptional regulator [Polyangiaceae bacterium]|nr:BolA family transcriptional regulator [Polyangiaceae bacterium]
MSSILERELAPAHLAVVDESARHAGGAGAQSHYNIVVVSAGFAGQGRLERHRRVHGLLADELATGLHALTLTLLTPDEWLARGARGLESPSCHGSSKAS